jgi:hypothetical protein
MKGLKFAPVAAALVCAVMLAPNSNATLAGTVPTAPTSTVFPGFVAPGTDPGTLLADEINNFSFSTTGGTTSGTIESAVYMEAGGTLDFYYQVFNSANSSTAIARLTATSFSSQVNDVSTGYRVDGSSLSGTTFQDGMVPPVTGDLNADGTVVGFSFQPPDSAKVAPGMTSNVLVVSTNATSFTQGNVSVIDGGTATVLGYQPTPSSTTPEPTSFLLLGGGLLALSGLSRLRRRA